MREEEIIARTTAPLTESFLKESFRELGLAPGMAVLLHCSLSSLGWVCGGALAVINALEAAVTPGGTVMMPTQSTQHSDPERWTSPPVPAAWIEPLRANFPSYDPARTPTRNMGVVPELFRTLPGVVRSRHPLYSFAASGPRARSLTGTHVLENGLGPESPLGRFMHLDGYVLLLGVGHVVNTSLHLAEYLAALPDKATIREGAPMQRNNSREWVWFDNIELDESDFEEIGACFEAEHPEHCRHQTVGCGQALLVRQRPLVEFAAAWMAENRH
jgi:aminoglycoside 3-N-acetyltransferase